jgi:NAD(P)-dependent dehydrogenase (short-subunit alcohol dehydrogenase family)
MSDAMDRGRVVVVTGASAGVGRAVARAFGARGASVALLARGAAGLAAAAAEIEAAGGRALAIPCDVSDADGVESAATQIERALGPIDVWVNGAMASVMAFATDVSSAEFRRVTDVTYLGTVWGTLAALRRMLPRDRGVIVQVGSAVAYRAIPLQGAYSGAKFAVRGFTDAVRTELLHAGGGVAITMVQLPAVNTPQFDWARSRLRFRAQPLPPVFEPEVAASAVLAAADHPRRELFVGGRATAGVAAQAMLPSLMDRFLAASGVAGQQTDEPEDPTRPDNLFEPLDADVDRGAHGRFRAAAHQRSLQLALNIHRNSVLAAVGAAGVLTSVLALATRRLPFR